ncbi:MAG: four helix bundle protein [Bdellovibrionota bacterium]
MLNRFYTFQMAKQYYKLCKSVKVPRFLQEQLFRASSSIALNLAEGSGKRTVEDQRRFYSIAYGSYRECQAILEIEDIKDEELERIGEQLGAMLYTLSRKEIKYKSPRNKTEPTEN